MKKYFSVILLVAACITAFAQQNAYYQQFAKYQMQIDVDAKNFTYKGTQTITYTNNSPDVLTEVYFHLYWNAFKPNSMMDQRVASQGMIGDSRLQKDGVSRLASIPKNEEGAQNIHWIRQNGKNLTFDVQETIMKVQLATPVQPNSTTTFTMEWDANIPMQIRRAGRNNREGVDMTMTQWYPKIAEYDYDGWSTFDYIGREFHAPFADFDININIDKDYVIGAGGILQNQNEVKGYSASSTPKIDAKGKVNWHWTAKNILDFAWAADRDFSVETFSVPDGPQVNLVYQKSDKTKFWQEIKPFLQKYYQIMNANFGKYAYRTYSFVQGGDGGMEYGMCTMILGEATSLQGLLGLMVHEGSHSWYQQMLATNESMYPWMDEGFTNYAEDFVMHQLFPPSDPGVHHYSDAVKAYINFAKSGREEPAVWLGDHHDGGTPYTYASYVKGNTFLIQLGYIMGEENLSKTMKEYFRLWSLKHPAPRDFMHIAQQVSGMDLKWFYHYWINTTKTIDYRIKSVEKTNTTNIVLENKGQIPMPVDLQLTMADGTKVNYHIPMNMTHTWKAKDGFGTFKTENYWPWTQKEYVLKLPASKSKISKVEIDASGRMADVNREDNVYIMP